jgi:hypothetical protein
MFTFKTSLPKMKLLNEITYVFVDRYMRMYVRASAVRKKKDGIPDG